MSATSAAEPPPASPQELDCKVVLVGDSKCGKTSLVQRFVSDTFTEVYTPTGFQKYSVSYDVGDVRMLFAIWDTAGAPAYDSVRPLAYQDAQVFLLCFSVADPASLDNTLNKWYPEIREHSRNTAVILCGCQVDLRTDRDNGLTDSTITSLVVTPEQGIAASREVKATTYVETSAKWSSKAVCDAFEFAALAALGRLNRSLCLSGDRPTPPRSKSKVDLKSELKRSCSVM